jgi:hypothetical protein
MDPYMKAGGRMTKLTEEEDLYTLTGMSMKEIGSMIKLMALGHTHILMERTMLVNGTQISKTELASRDGQMEQNTKAVILKVRSMELVASSGLMVANTWESLKITT